MYTVGQSVLFTATATGTDLVYVWEWWDGTNSVTTSNSVTKIVNRSGTLAWKVTVCDSLGRPAVQSSTISVAKPPEFSSITLTSNDSVLPFASTLQAVVVSPNFPVTCKFNGSTSIVAAGTGSISFAAFLPSAQTLVLSGTDSLGVVARFPIEFRGTTNLPPQVTAPQVIPAVFRIGTGLNGQIVVGAVDPEGSSLTFEWVLSIANGWASNQTLFGSTVPFGLGYQNTVTIPMTGQTAGSKTVTLNVKDANLATTSLSIPVVVVNNSVPVISGISIFPSTIITSGSTLVFTGTATDADNDPLAYSWAITGPVTGGSLARKAYVASVAPTGAGTINATLTVTDPYGGIASQAASPVTVN